MIRLAPLIAASLLATSASAQAPEPAGLFQGRDLFSLQTASDPQVSPDGRMIAYVRATGDVMNDRMTRSIWLVDVASGKQQPVGSDTAQSSSPRWSPDGERLSYVASAEGERSQLRVRWTRTGDSARVVTTAEAPQQIVWSPDGKRLAFLMFTPSDPPRLGSAPPKPEGARWADPLRIEDRLPWRTDAEGVLRYGTRQLYVVSADGGAPRQLTFGPHGAGGAPAFSPDGRHLFYSAGPDLSFEDAEIWRVPVEGGDPVRITSRDGPDVQPVVSPDGRLVAYIGYDDTGTGHHDTRLYVANPDGSGSRVLTAGLDRSVSSPIWSPDSRSVYVQYVDRAVGRVARIGLDGRVMPVAEGVAGGELDRPNKGGSFHIGGGITAFTTADSMRPAEVAVSAGGRTRRLTDLNADLIATRRLARIEPLEVVSSKDGARIDAWLVLPPNRRPGERVPLILEIHGGPAQSYGPFFATDMQLYAGAGYAVLYANSRNSTSYGQAFARWYGAGHEPFADYEDLMSAVDAAIAAGVADPDQLFVTGGSYGGYAAAAIIGKTDRFRAAAIQKPVINWTSKVLTNDLAVAQAESLMGVAPWEDPNLYWRHSPLSLVGNVKTPTLVVVGERDYRTPASESEQYYTALRMRGVPASYIVVPGAGHGNLTGRPSQSAAKASAIIAWFQRYRAQQPRASQ
jgi:dipeptidyl aminopeptidase/acylaminoacyl peptidase